MDQQEPAAIDFIVEAADRDLQCAVLQARFSVTDIEALRTLLGDAASDDPDLQLRTYHLDFGELGVIIAHFKIQFDPAPLMTNDTEFCLFRRRRLADVPYLIHTGYELPLLLDGRKKLAKMYHSYPPMTFEGEDRFDDWVTQGVLHREEVVEPFARPIRGYEGHRVVYYTPKGEEWRIPVTKLIGDAAQKSGGWNEYFERLEGMLFGYEDWQNDWWINTGVQGGGFGGLAKCCRVSAAGLAWIEASGFRALPPISTPELVIMEFRRKTKAQLRTFMLDDPDCVALVRFNVMGGPYIDLVGRGRGDIATLAAEKISQLNRHLRGSVVIVDRREDAERTP